MWNDVCPHADSIRATDQKLVAEVFIMFLYVHGLDLSVGYAGTVLGRWRGGQDKGETCPNRTRRRRKGEFGK